jgi:hypothetical protein
MIADYLPVVKWFRGDIDAQADFSKAGQNTYWKIAFDAKDVKTVLDLAFPAISLEGKFHPFARSGLHVILRGQPTVVDVFIEVVNFQSKKVSLVIKSAEADIQECIDWCRTGFILNEGPDQPQPPQLWKISGKAEIDAELKSVMGPQLIRKADGRVSLIIRNGVVTDIPGFGKALKLLNLSSVLTPQGGLSDGLKFATIAGTIDMEDGVAATRGMILLESPQLNIGIIGRVNFPKQVINARMLVTVVSLPKEVIAKIPVIGRNTTRDHGVVPIWLEIKGPLANPEIRILSVK